MSSIYQKRHLLHAVTLAPTFKSTTWCGIEMAKPQAIDPDGLPVVICASCRHAENEANTNSAEAPSA